MIDRSDWNAPVVTSTPAPTHAETRPPDFSAGNLTALAPDQPVPPIADDFEEDAVNYRRLLAQGIFTADELRAHYCLTDAEMAEVLRPKPKPKAPTLKDVDAELAEIAAARRNDRRAYFKNGEMQERELQLLEAREKLKAAPAETAALPADGSGLDPELLAQWEKQGGVDANLKQAQSTAQAVLDTLEPDDQVAFQQSFDALPETAQTVAFSFMAIPGGNWPAASDAAVQAFAGTEEGAELVTEWRDNAAKKLGVVQRRLDVTLRSMSDSDRSAAEAWFDALPVSQARAVIRALSK